MRELLILRHAEAEPTGPAGGDLERPLSAHGETQADTVGQWLREHDVLPDGIVCSPARRTRATLERVAAAWAPARIRTDYIDAIYEATPGQLLAVLDNLDSDAERVLLVGHNPGLERLLALLCEGRSNAFRGMPAAALARVQLHGPLEPGCGQLLFFHTS